MKKLLFGLLLMVVSSLQAQTYLRAETFTMGVRSSENAPIQWSESTPCSILVECYATKVIINSSTNQSYHIINQTYAAPDMNTWLCKDANGITCKFTMMRMYKYPGFMVCQVEYNDAIWFYVCTQE